MHVKELVAWCYRAHAMQEATQEYRTTMECLKDTKPNGEITGLEWHLAHELANFNYDINFTDFPIEDFNIKTDIAGTLPAVSNT